MNTCVFETTRLAVGPMATEAERIGIDLAPTIAKLLTPGTTVALPDAWRGDYTLERASSWVTEREADSTCLLVTDRSARPIGLLILAEIPLTETTVDVRIGYLIADDAWGNGYASELLQGAIKWAAAQSGLTSLTGGVDASNHASIRVLEKNGFRRIERDGDTLLFRCDVEDAPSDAASMGGRQVMRWELDGVDGAVVVIDVIRAFTTAAAAFGAGASAIYLVGSVEEALQFTADHPGTLAMGEDRGRRPAGFDFPNSPVAVSRADLRGKTLVQRTSAGTQGVVSAVDATRLWAASLACASATARAVQAAKLGDPAYVITGCLPDRPDHTGADDRLTADCIERARTGGAVDPAGTARRLLATSEARRTLLLGAEHCDPMDIEYAAQVDRFDFAMEVTIDELGRRLEARAPAEI